MSVLIDTWWNVNNCKITMEERQYIVLIDTWWNVNLSVFDNVGILDKSFNRYMVECK